MKRPIIYPYKMGSVSAKALSNSLREEGLRAKRVRSDGNYRPFSSHLIINWGSSPRQRSWDMWNVADCLNLPSSTGLASDKLRAFEALRNEVSIPDYTTDRELASQWLSEGHKVVVRHLTRANSGRGIEIIEEGEIPQAPLYTKYMKKRDEYRVHVFREKVIDVQQKKKRSGEEDANYQVRNHGNGWVFCREGVELPEGIAEDCIKAVAALGLDFGAVDVIWNEHYKKHYILEVNTAPNLEGTTLEIYTQTFKELCNE